MGTEIEAISTAYNGYLSAISTQMGISLTAITIIMTLASIWALCWKGIALWKAGQKKQIYWFIALLVVNSLGILEILYIFIFSKMGKKTTKMEDKPSKKKK